MWRLLLLFAQRLLRRTPLGALKCDKLLSDGPIIFHKLLKTVGILTCNGFIIETKNLKIEKCAKVVSDAVTTNRIFESPIMSAGAVQR